VALAPGVRLGPYEVIALIGAGGRQVRVALLFVHRHENDLCVTKPELLRPRARKIDQIWGAV
jgi:hypothetical protein